MSDEEIPEVLAAQALAELFLFYHDWLESQGLRESKDARKRFLREVHDACTEHPLANPQAQHIMIKTVEAYITSENMKDFLRMKRGIEGLN